MRFDALAPLGIFDAPRRAAIDADSVHQCAGGKFDIRAMQDGTQIRARGTRTTAARVYRDFAAREALFDFAVDVVGGRKPGRRGTRHQGLMQEAPRIDGGDAQRPVPSMPAPPTPPTGLQALEIRQHLGVAPALATPRRPRVEIPGVSPHIE